MLPVAGSFVPELPEGDDGTGSFVMRAVYTDQGEEMAPSLSGHGIKVLRSPSFRPADADTLDNIEVGRRGATVRSGGVFSLKDIDLTGIRGIEISSFVNGRFGHIGGDVEVRLGSASGKIIGTSRIEAADGARAQRSVDSGADAPRPRGRFSPSSVRIDINEAGGRHDLTLVFKNENADEDSQLLSLVGVKLRNTTAN